MFYKHGEGMAGGNVKKWEKVGAGGVERKIFPENT